MSQSTLSELEARYETFSESLGEAQKNDVKVLLKKSKEYEDKDLPMSFRIMQRIKALVSDGSADMWLNSLRVKMNQEFPEYMRVSSEEQLMVERSLVNRIKVRAVSIQKSKIFLKLRSTLGLIFVPLFIFSFYQIIWASERYESQARLIIKEPDNISTLDSSMALLAGLGATPTNTDSELIKAYIYSNDMLQYLEQELAVKEHFSDTDFDYFSRLEINASRESVIKYYIDKVEVEIDAKSSVISVFVQAFSPEFAQQLTKNIIKQAEWFINEISHKLAGEQLMFVQKEHVLTEERLQRAKSRLLTFQRRYNLLDPQAEGMASQQITYGLEAEIAVKQAQLRTLEASMSQAAPTVISTKSELSSLNKQMEIQRSKLTEGHSNREGQDEKDSVGEILTKFTDYKIDMEFALQAYSASKVSLEKSRIEAYRQIKYLVVVESPLLPEDARFPKVFYNVSLFFVLQLILIGIFKILLATVEELKQ